MPTEIEWRYTEKGERVRVSVKSGRIIPLPSGAKELEDFVNPEIYEGMNFMNHSSTAMTLCFGFDLMLMLLWCMQYKVYDYNPFVQFSSVQFSSVQFSNF